MTRFLTWIILLILLFWLIDRFLKFVKGYFTYQMKKAQYEVQSAPPPTKKLKFLRGLAVVIMICSVISFLVLLFFYFSGNTTFPFKRGVVVTVVVFFLTYWWYSEKLQSRRR